MVTRAGEKKKSENKSFYARLRMKLRRCVSHQLGLQDSCLVRNLETVVMVLSLWALGLLLFGAAALPPEGGLFVLGALVVAAHLVGQLVHVLGVHPLTGMLLTGILARTCGFYHLDSRHYEVVALSRDVALAVILIKAGLGLDPRALRARLPTILALTVLPCLAEALAAALAARFLLDLPWVWATLVGFLMSPTSPAIIVPVMLELREKGYGVHKGINTTVIAVASLDDILSMVVFSIIFYYYLCAKAPKMWELLVAGPKEIGIGLVLGLAWGLVCALFPRQPQVPR